MALGEVKAEEHLLPQATEAFQLRAQGDPGFEAVVRVDRVVFGFDFPTGVDVIVQPGVFRGGDPAAGGGALAAAVAFRVGLGDPAEAIVPNLPRAELLHLVGRMPAAFIPLIAHGPAGVFVVRIDADRPEDQLPGRPRLSLGDRLLGELANRRRLLPPHAGELFPPRGSGRGLLLLPLRVAAGIVQEGKIDFIRIVRANDGERCFASSARPCFSHSAANSCKAASYLFPSSSASLRKSSPRTAADAAKIAAAKKTMAKWRKRPRISMLPVYHARGAGGNLPREGMEPAVSAGATLAVSRNRKR